MSKSKRVLFAAAAAVSIVGPAAHAATSYTWIDLGGGTQNWNDATQWTPTGSPVGAAGAGDSANLNVALTSSLLINVPTGNYYVRNLQLGSSGSALTTDVGNANSGGGTLVLDGGTPAFGAYADISSLGSAGSTNIISAPIQLDQNGASSQTLNGRTGTDGNYLYNTTGVLNSLPPIGPIQTAIAASVIIDPSSTNNLTLSGPISQTVGVTAAIANLMTGGQTLTISGPISITNASSTVAQTFVLTGTSLSTTIVNGLISDGGHTGSGLALGNSNPTKTTVYPAPSPTIDLNNANTYTGVTTLNMATVLVGNNQAFGTEVAGSLPGATGELRLGGSANEFGYNLQTANDSITINNGVDVTQFLAIDGSHSVTFGGYLYSTVNRSFINLLPAGKTVTINGNVYIDKTTDARIWIFDGPGSTVVNGSIFNSSTADTTTTGSVTKSGTGTLLLNGTGSTYIGATAVNGGLLEFATPGSYGVQTSSTGTASILVNAGGAVALDSNAGATAGSSDSAFLARISTSSTGALALTALDASANLDFTSGTLASLANMSVGAGHAGVTYTGTITPGNSTYRLGGGGALTIPNAGGNSLTGVGNSLLVTNGGTVVLGGSNNYGGATTIQGVYVTTDQTRAATNDYSQSQGAFESTTLSVSALANGGAVTGSGIGSSSNAASNLVISGATLQYTGTGDTTDRLFSITSVGATLDASGAGAVDFTNAGAITQVEQAPITGLTVVPSGNGVPFNFIALPSGSTNMLAIGMTVSDTAGTFPAGSTVVGVSSNGFYINNNLGASALGDTLTFTNQNRSLTLTGTNTGQNILSAALGDSATGKLSVNKTGTGHWVLAGANTYTGGTTVNAGTLVVGANGALPFNSNVSITGGTLQLGTSTGLAQVASLAISGSGTLDVNNDHLIINYGSGPDPIASIAALLASGFAGGAWNGPGINSSAVASNPGYGVGYADSADPGNPAGLASGTLEIAFTLLGDADLNHIVNGVDFGILAANFNKGVSRWDQGDFDYNNIVNGIDFGSLAANFNKGASSASDIAALDAFAAANGLLADVPEPACGAAMLIAGMGFLARRRSRRICKSDAGA